MLEKEEIGPEPDDVSPLFARVYVSGRPAHESPIGGGKCLVRDLH